jgi:hypothetical protein
MIEYEVTFHDDTTISAFGHMWVVDRVYYFDQFEKGVRANWVDRFNQKYNTTVKSKREIFHAIGEENFKDFKRTWAKENLPKVKAWKSLSEEYHWAKK